MSSSSFAPELRQSLLDNESPSETIDRREQRFDSVDSTDNVLPTDTAALPQSSDLSADLQVDAAPTIQQFKALVDSYEEHVETHGKDDASTIMIATQIVFAFVGICAGFLYYDPAKVCVFGDEKGLSCDDGAMEKAIPSEVMWQWIKFLSGFVGYASTNVTFSFYGPPAFMEMLNSINNRFAKALATVGVGGFLAMQALQIKFAADGTGSGPLTMILSVTGSVPGAVFGGVGMISKARKMPAKVAEIVQHCYDNWQFNSLSLEKRQAMAVEAFYATQRGIFNAMLVASWKSVVAKAQTISVDENENKLTFLLKQHALPTPMSTLEKGFRYFMEVIVGSVLTSAATTPLINNTREELTKRTDDVYGQVLGAGALSAAMAYGNVVLTNKGIKAVSDVVVSKIKGEPIDSLAYQLRPWTARVIIGGSVAFAAFSYAIVDKTWNKLWSPAVPGEWQLDWQSAGRVSARAGMDAYHAVGPADVGMQLLFGRILKKGTPREQYLANTQLLVNYYLEDLSQKEFIKIMNLLTPAERNRFCIETWDECLQRLKNLGESARVAELNQMGLDKYSEAVIELTKLPAKEVKIDVAASGAAPASPSPKKSPTAQHWGSSNALLPPPVVLRGVSGEEEKKSLDFRPPV